MRKPAPRRGEDIPSVISSIAHKLEFDLIFL